MRPGQALRCQLDVTFLRVRFYDVRFYEIWNVSTRSGRTAKKYSQLADAAATVSVIQVSLGESLAVLDRCVRWR